MRAKIGFVLMVITLAIVSLFGCRQTTTAQEQSATSEKAESADSIILWVDSLDTALQKAASDDKMVFIDFYTTWCGFCKKLDRETFSDEEVITQINENFVAVKVDAEKEPNISGKYNIEGYPTIVVIDATGNEHKRIVGFRTAQELLAEI